MENDSNLAFDLNDYSSVTEKVEINVHPTMGPLIIEVRPDALTRGDFIRLSKLADDPNVDVVAEDAAVVVRAVASWNLTRGGEPLPITVETICGLTAVLSRRITKSVFDLLMGNLGSESA